MKKASKILYLVGGIVAIVWSALFLIVGVLFIVLGSVGVGNIDAIMQYIAEQSPEFASKITPEMLEAVLGASIGFGVAMLVEVAINIVGALFAFRANKEDQRWLAIVNIVFGLLGVTIAPAVGGIFQLITEGKEEKKGE